MTSNDVLANIAARKVALKADARKSLQDFRDAVLAQHRASGVPENVLQDVYGSNLDWGHVWPRVTSEAERPYNDAAVLAQHMKRNRIEGMGDARQRGLGYTSADITDILNTHGQDTPEFGRVAGHMSAKLDNSIINSMDLKKELTPLQNMYIDLVREHATGAGEVGKHHKFTAAARAHHNLFNGMETAGIPREWAGTVMKSLPANIVSLAYKHDAGNPHDEYTNTMRIISSHMRNLTNPQRELYTKLLKVWPEHSIEGLNGLLTHVMKVGL